MDYTTAFQQIGTDAAALYRAWDIYKQVFCDYIDAVVKALEHLGEALSEAFCNNNYIPPDIDGNHMEDLLEIEYTCRNQSGYTFEKERKPLRGLLRHKPVCYSYIPITRRNLPYQQRAY